MLKPIACCAVARGALIRIPCASPLAAGLHPPLIVGLAEVENQAVLEKLKSYLANPYDWQIVFDKDRDNHTGQDVAILTKFQIVEGSVTNFPDEREVYFVDSQECNVNPSKILGVELKIGSEPFYILITQGYRITALYLPD